jgi:hypothetical protein
LVPSVSSGRKSLALFRDESRFANAIRAIDGTHIEIIATKEPFDYFDRHHQYSVILQTVVGKNFKRLRTVIFQPNHWPQSTVFTLT